MSVFMQVYLGISTVVAIFAAHAAWKKVPDHLRFGQRLLACLVSSAIFFAIWPLVLALLAIVSVVFWHRRSRAALASPAEEAVDTVDADEPEK